MNDATHPENWRPIAGYEGLYDISDHGRVRSLMGRGVARSRPRAAPKILAQGTGRYAQVILTKDGIETARAVHVLVLEAFVGQRPSGMEAAHNDGQSRNNRASNLSWKTHADNHADKKRHGTWQAREANGCSKLTESDVAEIRRDCVPGSQTHGANALARKYGVSQTTVLNVVHRQTWTYQPQNEGVSQ